ncbi:MAG: hypothetical protein ACR2F2_02450 [Pyrinomonadaceae bacterium]
MLPTLENPVKVKDIYEAFIRFDDKPMITGAEAVRKSLIKYCYEGAVGIASGDGKDFTKIYLKENVPFLDIQDSNYWMVDKDLKAKEDSPVIVNDSTEIPMSDEDNSDIPDSSIENKTSVKEFKSLTISGKLPLDQFTASFGYFIAPFTMNGNKVEIEVKFKIHSTENSPLTESKQQYKNAKEAAKQLGLNLLEEIK